MKGCNCCNITAIQFKPFVRSANIAFTPSPSTHLFKYKNLPFKRIWTGKEIFRSASGMRFNEEWICEINFLMCTYLFDPLGILWIVGIQLENHKLIFIETVHFVNLSCFRIRSFKMKYIIDRCECHEMLNKVRASSKLLSIMKLFKF